MLYVDGKQELSTISRKSGWGVSLPVGKNLYGILNLGWIDKGPKPDSHVLDAFEVGQNLNLLNLIDEGRAVTFEVGDFFVGLKTTPFAF